MGKSTVTYSIYHGNVACLDLYLQLHQPFLSSLQEKLTIINENESESDSSNSILPVITPIYGPPCASKPAC